MHKDSKMYTVTPGFPKPSIQVTDIKLLVQACFSHYPFVNKLTSFGEIILQNVVISHRLIFKVRIYLYYYHKKRLHCTTWYCTGQKILHGSETNGI